MMTWPAMRQLAGELAFAHYLRRGHVPAWIQAIATAPTPSLALKYTPNKPRVPAGNPDGGEWTNGTAGGDSGGEDGSYLPSANDRVSRDAINPVYPEMALLVPPALRSAAMVIRSLRTNPHLNTDTEWRLGNFKSETKWANQKNSRGWTDDQITDMLKNGRQYQSENRVNPGNSSTVYINDKTGRYIVRDDETKEILQLGDRDMVAPDRIGK